MSSQWWRNAVVYQIYPRSFADADGDGIGDLPGITDRLPALAALGVDAVWLSPFYRSPQADAGYDVADYCDIDPLFGTLGDFDTLVAQAHRLRLKLIVDLVPNHSSDEHAWFQAALATPAGSPERARYLFRDGRGVGGSEPPNNWPSVFGGPAWTRTTDTTGIAGQWYLHLFDTKQPDFDWTNPEVRAEFVRVLRFWLDRGVDGFRVDVANSLIKADGMPDVASDDETAMMDADSAATGDADTPATAFGPSSPMWDQEGVHEIYREWRKVLDEYQGDRMMVAEAWVSPLSRLARYVRSDEMQQAFNFEYLQAPWDAPAIRAVIDASIEVNDSVGAPTTWVLSNHDVVRHASRFGLSDTTKRPNGIGVDDEQPDAALGLRRARAATLLMLALPGSAYLYQGEELGLPDHTTLDDDLRQDPTWARSGHLERGRDGCRVPIPWAADAPGLGFGPSGRTWLPQPDSFATLARDRQVGVPGSTWELYRAALAERRSRRLGDGSLSWQTSTPTVLTFRTSGLTVITNFGGEPVPLPAGEIVLASEPLASDGAAGGEVPPNTTVWLAG